MSNKSINSQSEHASEKSDIVKANKGHGIVCETLVDKNILSNELKIQDEQLNRFLRHGIRILTRTHYTICSFYSC